MQPPAYWAKIAAEFPDDRDLEMSHIWPLPKLVKTEDSARIWHENVKMLRELIPDRGSPDFDQKWFDFNGHHELSTVFVRRLKHIKNLDAWTMRQGPQRQLQAWLKVESVVDEDEMHVYMAADMENDFEFIVENVNSAIQHSFLRIHGVRDHECSPLAFHNQTFNDLWGLRQVLW